MSSSRAKVAGTVENWSGELRLVLLASQDYIAGDGREDSMIKVFFPRWTDMALRSTFSLAISYVC